MIFYGHPDGLIPLTVFFELLPVCLHTPSELLKTERREETVLGNRALKGKMHRTQKCPPPLTRRYNSDGHIRVNNSNCPRRGLTTVAI